MRVISLVPSATEIICALGFEDHIIGRSHECDFPPSIQAVPRCTRSLIDGTMSSKKIDEDVRYRLINGLSIYQIDTSLVSRLSPNVVVTQSQCNVCAIDTDEVRKEIVNLFGGTQEIEIVSLQATDLESIYTDIQRIAHALQAPSQGEALISGMKDQLKQLHVASSSLSHRPKVACIEWIEPLMAAGNWIPSLVELAGGENLFSVKGKASPWISLDDLIAADPDVIIIMACGFDINRTVKEMDAFFKNKGVKEISAIKNKQLFIVDANHFFVRPGPRIVDSLRITCEILHPARFNPNHYGTGWIVHHRGTEDSERV